MAGVSDIQALLRPSDWMTSLDIEKAYYHIPIATEFKKFFLFRFRDKGFRFEVMPFGLSTAPFLFTRVMAPIVNKLHSEGIRLVQYIDDFFIAAPASLINQDTKRVESLLSKAGFTVSEKSCRTPSRALKFLGIMFHTRR